MKTKETDFRSESFQILDSFWINIFFSFITFDLIQNIHHNKYA
jgi:hypothetical protein